MSTATCPECGKPLRLGARYCGNCGALLSGASAARPEAVLPELTCSNCGNSLRPGVRFCNRCGQPIDPGAAVTVPQALVGGIPAGAPAEAAAQAGQATPKPPAGLAQKPEGSGAPRRAARGPLLLLVLLVLVLGCGLAAAAGYLAARQYGWLCMETPLAAIPPQTAAIPTVAGPTLTPPSATPTLTATQTRPTPMHTTAQPTDTATLPAPATELAPPGETALAPTTTSMLLFEDTFDGGLSQHWLTWGEPRATIGAGFGDNWLDLKAIDPDQAGVTTRPALSIPGAPGLVIEFDAQMDGRYPQAVVLLDWDPAAFDRGPVNQAPGLIRLEIRPGQLELSGRATRETCHQLMDATARHTYLLRLEAGLALALYLDEADQPACRLADLGFEPQPGKLSFSGLGWVSRVKVLLPK
jgi:hypothetical protein